MNTRKVATITMLVALAVGTNYAMIALPNIKLMDVVVFLGGFLFGPIVGALTGIISWAVYGVLNPIGFSLHIWLATMFSETIYGVAGGLVRKTFNKPLNSFKNQTPAQSLTLCVFFGALGLLLTLMYDVATNIVFGYVNNLSILSTVIIGFVPFGFLHEFSNAYFFGVGCVPAIYALSVAGGENLGVHEK